MFVQYVTNSLQVNYIYRLIQTITLDRTRMLAADVEKSIRVVCVFVRTFILVNKSAQNVANVVEIGLL